eukprot:8535688-Pyramimonas_sp.AAC.1
MFRGRYCLSWPPASQLDADGLCTLAGQRLRADAVEMLAWKESGVEDILCVHVFPRPVTGPGRRC